MRRALSIAMCGGAILALAWGAVRVVGYGEQQPARAMALGGATVLLVFAPTWLEGRRARQWPYWLASAILWLGGGALVLDGRAVVGVTLLVAAAGVLLLLSWRRRITWLGRGGDQSPSVMDTTDGWYP
jgi:hypothetical protein